MAIIRITRLPATQNYACLRSTFPASIGGEIATASGKLHKGFDLSLQSLACIACLDACGPESAKCQRRNFPVAPSPSGDSSLMKSVSRATNASSIFRLNGGCANCSRLRTNTLHLAARWRRIWRPGPKFRAEGNAARARWRWRETASRPSRRNWSAPCWDG
jgi:hypothetical protein